jgi:hydroxymethylpyrimidine/phosphomethylpyrimidine kinase
VSTLLVISGLDPTGGAGFLADARVAAEHGARVVGVITASTIQDTAGVRAALPLPPEHVGDALAALLSDVEVDAVKIGMLGDARTAATVARALAATRAPVVWDPVLRASRGAALLAGDVEEAAAALLPEARLVTPNVDEARALTGLSDLEAAGRALVARGARAALVKGGHLPGDRSPDVLVDGDRVEVLDAPRLDAGPLHGTGCVLSTAIAARLARGEPLAVAARGAKAYLAEKIAGALAIGRGARCLV